MSDRERIVQLLNSRLNFDLRQVCANRAAEYDFELKSHEKIDPFHRKLLEIGRGACEDLVERIDSGGAIFNFKYEERE